MALLKKKTRQRVTKQLRKLVKKHGEEVVSGMVTTAAASVAAKSAGDTATSSKKHKASPAGDAVTQPKKQKTEKRPKSTARHASTA